MKTEIWECKLGEQYQDEDDWEHPYRFEGLRMAGDNRCAAEAFADYAWSNHDMWECGIDGFEVIVRKADNHSEIYRFQIEVEIAPQFRATEEVKLT